MLSVHPFHTMPVCPAGDASSLLRPDDSCYETRVYEATDEAVARDLLTDRQLVPKGLVRDQAGNLRAIFWQLRPGC